MMLLDVWDQPEVGGIIGLLALYEFGIIYLPTILAALTFFVFRRKKRLMLIVNLSLLLIQVILGIQLFDDLFGYWDTPFWIPVFFVFSITTISFFWSVVSESYRNYKNS